MQEIVSFKFSRKGQRSWSRVLGVGSLGVTEKPNIKSGGQECPPHIKPYSRKSSRPTVPCDGAENEPVGRRWVPAETL